MPQPIYLNYPTRQWQSVGPQMVTDLWRSLIYGAQQRRMLQAEEEATGLRDYRLEFNQRAKKIEDLGGEEIKETALTPFGRIAVRPDKRAGLLDSGKRTASARVMDAEGNIRRVNYVLPGKMLPGQTFDPSSLKTADAPEVKTQTPPKPGLKSVYNPETGGYDWRWIKPGETFPAKPPEKEKPPSSPMEAFFRDNPNASPEEAVAFKKQLDATPKSDITIINGVPYQIGTNEVGEKIFRKMTGVEPGVGKTIPELTHQMLYSKDPRVREEAENVLKAQVEQAYQKAKAAAGGKMAGLKEAIDIDGVAEAILDGRETIENVKNTFGVPLQEMVRKEVMAKARERGIKVEFMTTRALAKAYTTSLRQQEKNRGMMKSFVDNIAGQIVKVKKLHAELLERFGVRALDLPRRELTMRIKGSGEEAVLGAYMKEISAEIAKLAQGSAASVQQLPEANRQEWERIHDPNLSMNELLKVLNATNEMAQIRYQSVTGAINETMDKLGNITRRPYHESESSKYTIELVE